MHGGTLPPAIFLLESFASWNESLILQGQIHLTLGGIFPESLRRSPLLA